MPSEGAAQVPPSPSDIAAYAGLHAAAHRGDAAEIKRYLHPGESPLQEEGRDTIAELIAAGTVEGPA